MDANLRKSQLLQLQLALEVKRICDKHNIDYFLTAGTLLGAVRHGGFIPWDDDMDIGMLRKDYEKFLAIAKEELNRKYFLQNWNSEEEFAFPYSKLRINGTKYIEESSSSTDLHKGIYIDIFPFDNIPNNKIKQRIQAGISYILRRLILAKSNYKLWSDNQILKKILYRFLKVITLVLSYKLLHSLMYTVMTLHNNICAEKVTTFGGAYGYDGESLKREWLENLTELNFEGESFLTLNNYHEFLSKLYGDYMTPPPENKRGNRHGIINIDFGMYD